MSEDQGHYRRYVDKKFQPASLHTIRQADAIIQEYAAKGRSMTLRQLHYQFVARKLYENTDQEYDRLGNLISDGRLAGLISWEAIEDRTRYTRELQTFLSPTEAVRAARSAYRHELWADQPFRPVVGIEKDAMIGNISDICYELRVPFCSFRGYSSQSQLWRLGQQLARYVRDGQTPIFFHLGDWDADGVDMTRDVRERLSMFAGTPINVQRLSLNMDQVDAYDLPPNTAKTRSARKGSYQAIMEDLGHGDRKTMSWEMDSLPPDKTADLIKEAVDRVRDEKLWSAALAEEAAEKDALDEIINNLTPTP